MGAAAGWHPRLNPTPITQTAGQYAQQLLDSLAAHFGVRALRSLELPDEHPAISWARSGLMALTGSPDAAPQMCPAPLAACADGALAALAVLTPGSGLAGLRGSQLLAERAAIAGHVRAGRVSPGGSCRLLDTADGVLALNLAREDDWDLLPAWLEREDLGDWAAVARCLREYPSAELVTRGRLLGLAVASSSRPPADAPDWFSVCASGPRRQAGTALPPRVLDLASLWAGPLCSHLLQAVGAEVIKVESLQRPDGARRGPAQFFDLLNAGKRSVALDFGSEQGRAQLRALIASADIVIEASRPRALRQLGIHAEACLQAKPGLTWIALSGYGRGDVEQDWIAYGDDAAVAAGLSQLQFQACGEPMIVGDAIADPLSGLHAALLASASHASGGGRLLALSLRDVVRHCMDLDLPQTDAGLRQRQAEWTALVSGQVANPRARPAPLPAPALGADTATVLRGLGIAC